MNFLQQALYFGTVLAWLYCRRRGRSRRRRRVKEESQKGETLEAHISGVYEGIFVFSKLLGRCGRGELVGAVFKARSARLENRVSLASLALLEKFEKHSEKQHGGHENQNTKSADDCLQILSDDIVPELKVIKSLLKSPTLDKKPDDLNLDLDFDDINRSISTLTNDIQEINKKIAQNEENTKLFHSFKEALDTNNEKLGQEVKNTICHELKNSSNLLVELNEKMHKYEGELMKKTMEIKKCVIKESS